MKEPKTWSRLHDRNSTLVRSLGRGKKGFGVPASAPVSGLEGGDSSESWRWGRDGGVRGPASVQEEHFG